ncbi:TIGR03086 family metal-binding protein [Nonomuraea sp. NPDC046570]|uniref:TIGR03086 family metal-binding protein n=1 Tax=Nonomuraea sp. NPDC046570 TaxID=3155255 RepID=UPI0033D43D34
MTDMMPLMTRAAERTLALVGSLRPDELALRTPCAEFDVKALIAHLEYVAAMMESAARKEGMPAQQEYQGDLPRRVERMLDAWSKPEAWEGVSAGLGLPMTTLATMCLGDLVTHGWDLAKATGRPYETDSEAVELLIGFIERMGPMARQQGVYGEPVPVPDDAPALDRMLGLSGRDPAWTP